MPDSERALMPMNPLTARSFCFLIALGLLFFALAPARAADEGKAADQARRQQAMQRKLQAEKAALSAELDNVKRSLDEQKTTANKALDEQAQMSQSLGRLRQDLTRAQASGRVQRSAIQQLEASQVALSSRLEVGESERLSLQNRLAAAESRANNAAQSVKELKATLAELETERASLGRQLTNMTEEVNKMQQTVARSDATRTGLERTLAERKQQLQACDSSRQGLERTARELLVRFRQETCLPGLMQGEPLMQLRRVAIQSEAERYREVIDGHLANAASPAQQ